MFFLIAILAVRIDAILIVCRVPTGHAQPELRPGKQRTASSNLPQTLSERNIDTLSLPDSESGWRCETFRSTCSPASEPMAGIAHHRRGVTTEIMSLMFRPSLPAEVGGRGRNKLPCQYRWCQRFGRLVLYLQRTNYVANLGADIPVFLEGVGPGLRG